MDNFPIEIIHHFVILPSPPIRELGKVQFDFNDDPFFADLNKQLEAVSTKSKLEAEKAKQLKTLSNRRASHSAKIEASQRLLEVSQELHVIQWEVSATVALFAEQLCSCGESNSIFLHYLREEKTVSRPLVKRWSRIPSIIPNYPVKALKQTTTTPVCKACAETQGFNLSTAEIFKSRNNTTFAPGNSSGEQNA